MHDLLYGEFPKVGLAGNTRLLDLLRLVVLISPCRRNGDGVLLDPAANLFTGRRHIPCDLIQHHVNDAYGPPGLQQ